MEHAAHMVDVLDSSGNIAGNKARRDINKAVDIYHSVFIILITPRGEIVLGVIPAREDLPNYYARQMSVTMATIRRTGETPEQAALRGIERELFIDHADVKSLGNLKLNLPEGRTMFASVYYVVADPPQSYSVIDIDTLAVVTPHQLRTMIMRYPHEIAPTMHLIWSHCHHKLPI
jgi:hypothetical protein